MSPQIPPVWPPLSGCVLKIWVTWEQFESRTGRHSPKGVRLICRKARRATGLEFSCFTLRSNRSGVRISPGAPDALFHAKKTILKLPLSFAHMFFGAARYGQHFTLPRTSNLRYRKS